MMLVFQKLFIFTLLHGIACALRINMYYTNWENPLNGKDAFLHDCLHVDTTATRSKSTYQILSYCLTERNGESNIEENDANQMFTFVQLQQMNITSEQLITWSAPIDIAEHYQFYLNQLSVSNQSASMKLEVFYNCTLPRFGTKCQYSLDSYQHNYSSLHEIIYDFYREEYKPTSLTCYTHLECDRGSTYACLDWSEICNGQIDCYNTEIDEEHCWQLEINECGEDEYRCTNGQCIPKIFLNDDSESFDCLDKSDEIKEIIPSHWRMIGEPVFSNEDITCSFRRFVIFMRMTSSCLGERDALLQKTTIMNTPNSLHETCWSAFKCYYDLIDRFSETCIRTCLNEVCVQLIKETCPDFLMIPAGPIAFGHIHVLYMKNNILYRQRPTSPDYLCYNDRLCGGFTTNATLFNLNGSVCRQPKDFPIIFSVPRRQTWYEVYAVGIRQYLHQCNTILYKNQSICNSSMMYQCVNSSKCISIYRLCDSMNDCDYKDDEQCDLVNGSCVNDRVDALFKCTNAKICISSKRVHDRICDCGLDKHGLCDDEVDDLDRIRKHISFPNICDGFTDLIPMTIDGSNETDETECESWQCNNIYTHCNGIWNCLNGADEINCDASRLLICSHDQHVCVSSKTNQLVCLPIEKANDGVIDCIGGLDEPKFCLTDRYELIARVFYCITDHGHTCLTISNVCNYRPDCTDNSDELFCFQKLANSVYRIVSDAQHFIFQYANNITNRKEPVFLLSTIEPATLHDTAQNEVLYSSSTSVIIIHNQRCHRGLPLTLWSNTKAQNLTIPTCLCPPSFYGNQCQYQNQRVSLTMLFQAFSESRRTLFVIMVQLIDDTDEQIVHSYQQLTYIYTHHCRTKYNVYLLYSNRPKLTMRNYFIRVDAYERISFEYRGSMFIPINFPFLPVHRIAVQLYLAKIDPANELCSNEYCVHGHCIKYLNDPKRAGFCRCDSGWSGKHCDRPYKCTCASDSLCIGVSADNRSICICPLNKWGSRCLLSTTVCYSNQSSVCHNNGKCLSLGESAQSRWSFLCICSKGFSGERCEIPDKKLIISFHKDVMLPKFVMIHFIRVMDKAPPENGSTFKSISINQKFVIIQWPHPFHIAFAKLDQKDYYLITIQNTYNRSSTITKTITSQDRCKNVHEIFDETIANYHPLRRIKHYHVPCQTYSPSLSCFYDESQFCLCYNFDHRRLANCFEFNSSIKHDCFGQSNCENGAQCLQDKAICPRTSICVCPKCFYGTRCQFSSAFVGVSLDAILGYHIQPHVKLNDQPSIVRVSIALTTLLISVGVINGLLSLITFNNNETKQVGCGFYLFGSSITTTLIVILFTLKFWILIVAQKLYMTNRPFLTLQCISIDFLLRVCLNMDQWLNACVAIERAHTVIQGTHFDKKKSIKIAKYAIFFLIIIAIGTSIHDPIHRRLLYEDHEDDEDKRIWCIVSYSTNLQTYNSIINVTHFIGPFFINIISALIIIVMTAWRKNNTQTNRTYRNLFREQFSEHSYLLISPIVLVILGLPRLIISFVSSCMDSYSSSWLFLIGYIISFVPPMITFLVFVIPSKFYKLEFQKSIIRYRQIMHTTLRRS